VPRSEPASSSRAQPAAPLAHRTQPASLIWPNGRVAGRLRYDAVVNGRMHILSTWLLTTSDGQVAARIATLLGRQPHMTEPAQSRSTECSVATRGLMSCSTGRM
jgi:hypothetical protein